MIFLQPFLLWGALAVGIPVIIHFWHQKKGKPLAWAATQWLVEKNQQQQRGLKLDNILLLVLRCLLLVLLAILLSQPVLKGLERKTDVRPVHLVQPSALVTSNFRFELEEAAKREERLYWINDRIDPVDQPAQLPSKQDFTALRLQAAIDKVRQENAELHLYLLNTAELASVPAIYVPGRFHLHTLPDSTRKTRPFLATKRDRKLFVNQAGKLTSSATLDPAVSFQTGPAHRGPLRVLLNYRDKAQQQTVEAALKALAESFDLDWLIEYRQSAGTGYDWVLTDRPMPNPVASTLYIISGMMGYSTVPNVRYSETPFTAQTDERVASGQLPEWLGERLVDFYDLRSGASPLKQKELKALFVVSNRPDQKPQTLVHTVLVLLFAVLLLAERWIALTKNA